MSHKIVLIFITVLLFGAASFGGGVLFGQHVLVTNGYVYAGGENAQDGSNNTGEAAAATVNTDGEETDAAVTADDDVTVNINTAGYEELLTVNGIGEVTANKILDARAEAGVFKDTYDLVTYGVMGDAKYNHLKIYLTVE